MLKKLHIQNFQSHRDSTIEFSPYLTIIVGQNDNGKSAIFRALMKVIRNVPDGTGFVSWWKDVTETNITLETDAGTVLRSVNPKKGTPGNRYVVNSIEYAGFGKNIPPDVGPIAETANPIVFGDVSLDLNFGGQHGGLFLIDDTGSARGKVLGKIVGVDVVGRKRQIVESERQSNEREIKRVTLQVETLEKELATYPDVEAWVGWVSGMQRFVPEHRAKEKRVQRMGEININRLVLQDSQEAVTYLIAQAGSVSQLSTSQLQMKVGQLKTRQNVRERIVQAQTRKNSIVIPSLQLVPTDRVMMLQAQLIVARSLSTRYKTLQAKRVEVPEVAVPTVEAARNVGSQLQQLATLRDKHKRLFGMRVEGVRALSTANIDCSVAVLELEARRTELGVCPTCGKPF